MKTKTQKIEELKRAKELLEKSKALIFADFTKVSGRRYTKVADGAQEIRREFPRHQKAPFVAAFERKGNHGRYCAIQDIDRNRFIGRRY